MSFPRRYLGALATCLGALTFAMLATAGCGPAVPDKPTWDNDIAPLFAAHCNRCHDANGPYKAFVETSDQAAAEAMATAINKAVHGTYMAFPRMPPPPAQVLADWQIETIENWTRSVQQ